MDLDGYAGIDDVPIDSGEPFSSAGTAREGEGLFGSANGPDVVQELKSKTSGFDSDVQVVFAS